MSLPFASSLILRAAEIMREYPQAVINPERTLCTSKWYELPNNNVFIFDISQDGGHIQLTAFMPASVFRLLEIDAVSSTFYFWDDTASWNMPILLMRRPSQTRNGRGHITLDLHDPHVVERVIRHIMRVIIPPSA